jgi:hypothetical protein
MDAGLWICVYYSMFFSPLGRSGISAKASVELSQKEDRSGWLGGCPMCSHILCFFYELAT